MATICLAPVTDPVYLAQVGHPVPQGINGTWQMGNFMIFADGTYVDISQWTPTSPCLTIQGPDPGYAGSAIAQYDPSSVLPTVAPQPVTITPAPTANALNPPPPAQTPTLQQIANGQTVTGNEPAPTPAPAPTAATAWIESNWPLVAAGAAALVILPMLMGGRR